MSNLFAEIEARRDIKINNLVGTEPSVDRDIAGRMPEELLTRHGHILGIGQSKTGSGKP